ncbi:MAG: recombination mediator RecR [Bacillota bacterium]|nr:recombination mediator RecR [Bacillota bacterium]
MALSYPQSLNDLIRELSRLPGVGAKSAQRMAFHLLGCKKGEAEALAEAISAARARIHACPECGNYTDGELCAVCTDNSRDRSLLCVIESARDIASMERSRSYNGLYHVLGGVISPMDGVTPDKLNIAPLMRRIETGAVREVVMATNPDVEGETTALYLAKKIKPYGVRVSRIAHGLPVGGDLEYADEATLSLALNGRKEL